MARTPTPTSRSNPVLLQPQAAPVDTFVQPAPSGLREIAAALTPLNRELGVLFEERAEKEREAATKEADALFVQTNQAGYVEGVRRGLIPAHLSPITVKRYKQLEGDALGRRMRAGILAEYETWEGRNGTDPNAIDTFVDDYIQRHAGTADPEVLAAAQPHILAMSSEAWEADSRYRSGQFREGAMRSSLAAVSTRLDDANYEGRRSGTGTDYAANADAVEQVRANWVAGGGDPLEWDRNAMELTASKAVELKDPKLLDFFDRKIPGTEITYGDTKEGGELRQRARDQLDTIARQETLEGDRAAEKDRKAREDAATRSAIDAMVAGEPVPEEVLAAGEKADPLFRTRVGEWRDNLAKGERDPQLVREIKQRIMDGEGMAAVHAAAPSLTSNEDLNEVVTFAKGFETARPTVDDVLGSTSARTVFDALASRTKSAGTFLDPITGMSNEGMEAQYDFRRLLTEWAVQNPNATALERDEAVGRIGRSILDRFKAAADGSGVSQYDRAEELGGQFANPFTGATETGTANAPASDGGGGLPPSMDGTGEAPARDPEALGRLGAEVGSMAPPADITTRSQLEYWESFSAEEKAKIQERAGASGKPLGAVLDQLKGVGAKPKGKPAPAPAEPQPQAGITPISYRPDAPSIADISSSPTRAAAPDLAFLSSRAIQGAERSDSFTGMRPEFASGLEAMLRGAPPEIASGLQVMSGYRSPQRQAELWAAALRKYGSPAAARKWVAPPGRSGHNHGHAADLAYNGQRLDKAPRRVREWVHANAAAYGLAFPLGNEAWHVELAGARNGKGQAHVHEGRRSFTRDDAEAFLQAAMMSDPLDLPEAARDGDGAFVPGDVGAGRLLDLIGQHESAGNYNAVFGNADSTRDLGQLTLNEIIAQQRRAKRRGAYSTAIGKYQFLRKTLESLRDELGLTGNERFDPDLQDRLAVALLERRGYRQFRDGKLSARAFALRLSQEWASVEKPGTGRSYYAGDGFHGNAPVKTREVYAALGLPSLSI